MKPSTLTAFGAEGAGTALLVGIGTGSIVEAARLGETSQAILAIPWFLAVAIPIVLFISVSGAHLNPVVTLALAVSGRISWRQAPAYWVGQFAGAFLGSAVVWALLGNGAHLGATVPSGGDVVRAFPAEFAFTAALIGSVFLLADRGEGRWRWRLLLPPTVVGLSTYFIGAWTGSSLNPARTLAPAVLASRYTDLWVYLLAVPLGALAVAVVWKPRAVDRLDRGPGRIEVAT